QLFRGFLLLAMAVPGLAAPIDPLAPDNSAPATISGMKLFWNDEFKVDGKPDAKFWSSESGFVRNEELQWYRSQNAACIGGVLRFEGRKERVANPKYSATGSDWKTKRQYAEYTSTSLTTSGKVSWKYGHLEIRARLDGQFGSWPAIWTLGASGEWPTNGEVDIMEFYPSGTTPLFHANCAWGTATRWNAAWNAKTRPLSEFTSKDPDWLKKFHLLTMDWTKDSVVLKLDNTVMNAASTAKMVNNDGTKPYTDRAQYGLLNLAIGANGGDPSKAVFPMVFEVDYFRVYQPGSSSLAERLAAADWKIRATPGIAGQFLVEQEIDPSARIEVLSANGRQILEQPASATTRIDLRQNPSGIYLVRLKTSAGTLVTKILR
ncbi:MAG: family 16 glycosylhydrolase, partial [Fibrobacterota bacterium]